MTKIVHSSIFATGSNFNHEITTENFGINFEARGTSSIHGSAVEGILSDFPGSIIRYPGGTPTENYFDLSNPDNSNPQGIFAGGSSTEFTPLSQFLNFASTQEMSVAIVIPTFRFFDKQNTAGDYLKPSARSEIYTFVTKLVAGQFGIADISALEIGNEWFNSRMLYNAASNPDGWTPAEFAVLQNAIVEVISTALQEVQSSSKPQIWIQSSQNGIRDLDGNGAADNREFFLALSAQSLAEVDGVVDHVYQPTRGHTPFDVLRNGLIAGDRVDRLAEAGFDVGNGGRHDVIASEWNVRAARNDGVTGDDANITGFERLPLVLALFSDMTAAGVDTGMIYTAQSLGLGGGFGTLSTLGSQSLTPTGLLFSMMAEVLPGTVLHDPNADGEWSYADYVLQNLEGVDTAFTFQFQSSEQIVIYYASGVMDEVDFSISGLNSYLAAGHDISVKLLTAANGENPLLSDATGSVQTPAFSDFFLIDATSDTTSFSLSAYQVVQIVIDLGDGHLPPRNERLTGGLGSDRLVGGDGQDTLDGASGNDTLIGDAGVDHLSGGIGDDVLDGGDHEDFAYFMGSAAAFIDLGENSSQNTGHGLDTIVNIEHVVSGSGHDRLVGNAVGNRLSSGSGNDNLFGARGDDTLDGSEGNDLLDGGDGIDTALFMGTAAATVNLGFRNVQNTGFGLDRIVNVENLVTDGGNDRLTGNRDGNLLSSGAGNDTLDGGGGDDVLEAGASDDHLSGGTGNDTLAGGTGSDVLIGGFGDDVLDGGEGIDRVYFAGSRAVTINLALTTAQDTGHGLDTIRNIENIFGGSGRDWLIGNAAGNSLVSGRGNDTLEGGDGNDTLDGGEGTDLIVFTGDVTATVNLGLTMAQHTGYGIDRIINIEDIVSGAGGDFLIGNTSGNGLMSGGGDDTLDGAGGNDRLEGGAGQDQLSGGIGHDRLYGGLDDDLLNGGTGNDLLDGGDGIDRASFTGTVAVTVNLALTTAQNTGHGIDTILNIENVTSGGGNDRLIGNAGNNDLNVGSGNDTLSGGRGNDALNGGDGSDVFIFNTTLGADNVDRIIDFSVLDDAIHVDDAVFVGLSRGALAAASFVTDAAESYSDTLARIIYETDTGRLYFDADGSGSSAAQHFATLTANLALTHADFFIV
jgi:Ca2+-binding RTX toxin-like protein